MQISEFEQKLASAEQPLIVDFWAPWCGPCRMTKPVLDKLAQEYAGRVDFLPVNADESRELLGHYKILGIPTVLAFREGKLAARLTGAQSEANYRQMFTALSEGQEVKVTQAPANRMLRLGAGLILIMLGLSNQNGWLLAIGGLVTFSGVYDRCPIWQALTSKLQRK